MSTIVFTGGGTGGHVYPGLAVLAALPAALRSRAVWVGSRSGVERGIVAAAGVRYASVPTGKLRRYIDLQNVLDLFRVLLGTWRARRLLAALDARVVFSKGGFVAVPVVWAAALRGIPVIIHESDADPGLATRITAPAARTIMVPYRETADAFPERLRRRIIVSGNPVRRAFREADPDTALARIGLVDDRSPVVLVTGGSLGARQINLLIGEVVEQLTARAVVVHQTGEHGAHMIPELTARARAGRYHGAPSFDAEFPALLRRADLVIARSGAGTVWEIATCGRPAVLVPLSTGASRGDQIRNAARYASAGTAVVLDDPDLSAEKLAREVTALLDDEERRQRMSTAAAAWASTDAVELIAECVIDAFNGSVRRDASAVPLSHKEHR